MTTTADPLILKALATLTTEVASLRSALDIQFKRIAAMQAEIDLLPASRRRRHLAMTSRAQPSRAIVTAPIGESAADN
jgi:hypothetical protein